jgi:acyl-CoA thioester hydrolase
VSAPHAALENFPIVIETPIAWGEMDAYQHVNNIVYFRWFESARIAYLDAINFRDPAAHDGIGPILHSTRARFRRALTYPDTVLVGARVTELSPDMVTMEYRIVSRRINELAADGIAVVVPFNYTLGQRAQLPAAVAERIRSLDGSR